MIIIHNKTSLLYCLHRFSRLSFSFLPFFIFGISFVLFSFFSFLGQKNISALSIVHNTTDNFYGGTFSNVADAGSSGSPNIKLTTGQTSGTYTSGVNDLGVNVLALTSLAWTEGGVGTGDGETPYSTTGLVAQWNFNEASGSSAVSGGTCGT